MFITMEEFQAKEPSKRQLPLNCFIGSSGSGKTTTAVACYRCSLIPSVTTREQRKNEPPHIKLTAFLDRVNKGSARFQIRRGSTLQEYVHASPEEFARLEENRQFLWTYVSSRGNHYGTLEVSVQEALHSRAEPSIMIITPESAIWLAQEYAPGKVNCFFFEPPRRRMQTLRARETSESINLRLQEERTWEFQAAESDVPFVVIPGRLSPWDKAKVIKEAILSR